MCVDVETFLGHERHRDHTKNAFTTCALKDRNSKGKLFLDIFRSNDIMIVAVVLR